MKIITMIRSPAGRRSVASLAAALGAWAVMAYAPAGSWIWMTAIVLAAISALCALSASRVLDGGDSAPLAPLHRQAAVAMVFVVLLGVGAGAARTARELGSELKASKVYESQLRYCGRLFRAAAFNRSEPEPNISDNPVTYCLVLLREG